LFQAVRAREYCADSPPEGIEVWKYAFSHGANQPVQDIHVRFTHFETASGGNNTWTGCFECARDRHVDVIPWPAANAIVVVSANAVYIVNPGSPEQFGGVAARLEINDVTFDESMQRLFIADSRRIYAFSADGLFRWISEPLDGYGARFRGCGRRVLAVEIKQTELNLDSDESAVFSVVRLRTEDGTILRSRFRRGLRYWTKKVSVYGY
jgi:hypothetical protein